MTTAERIAHLADEVRDADKEVYTALMYLATSLKGDDYTRKTMLDAMQLAAIANLRWIKNRVELAERKKKEGK